MIKNFEREIPHMCKATTLAAALSVLKPFPLNGENFTDFYVDTRQARGDDPVVKMTYLLEYGGDDFYQKILFIGHLGSGKSTELYRIQDNLKNKFKVLRFSIRDETDIQDLTYIDFIFAVMTNILRYLEENEYGSKIYAIENLFNYWNEENIAETVQVDRISAEADIQAKASFLFSFACKVKGIFQTGKETKTIIRKKIEPSLKVLINNINDIINELENCSHKKFLLIIEDLDKLDIPQAEELFIRHRKTITSLNLNCIFTLPIYLFYSPSFVEIRDDFDSFQLLSMIKVKEKNGEPCEVGIETLKEIVNKRVAESLFDQDGVEFAIDKSGGSIRDIFYILMSSVLNAKLENVDSEFVTYNHIKQAYFALKNTYERFAETKYLKSLKDLYNDPLKKPIDEDSVVMELLKSTAIIEYNCERWCNIHPALEDFLRQKGVIS